MDHGLPEPVAAKLGPLARYELRLVLLVLAFASVAIPFGLLLHQVLSDGPLTTFDEEWAQSLNNRFYGHDAAIAVLHVISFTGKPIFLLFAVGVPCLWLYRNGAYKLVAFLAVTCIGGGIVDTIVKVAVGRPRPEVENPIISAFGKSFPSGHSMQAVVCYGALLLVFLPVLPDRWRRPAIIGTVAWILAIGFSRLSLGVHYVSDVLGGYTLGAAWLAGSVAVWETWREDRGRRRTVVLTEGVEPEEKDALPVG